MAYQKNFAGVPFKTLLDKAHKDYNLAGVDTEILQVPCAENGNMAIFRATVLSDGATFSAHGDADPNNTTSTIAPHLLRMAETRAIARALRWLTNSGETAIVEISGDEDESGPSGPSQTPPDEPLAGNPDQTNAPLPPKPPDAKTEFLNRSQGFVAKINDKDQATIVLATCGYDSLDDVRPQDFRRVHDALKAKHTEIEEKRAATKLTAN
jgi:hypothetical protein